MTAAVETEESMHNISSNDKGKHAASKTKINPNRDNMPIFCFPVVDIVIFTIKLPIGRSINRFMNSPSGHLNAVITKIRMSITKATPITAKRWTFINSSLENGSEAKNLFPVIETVPKNRRVYIPKNLVLHDIMIITPQRFLSVGSTVRKNNNSSANINNPHDVKNGLIVILRYILTAFLILFMAYTSQTA